MNAGREASKHAIDQADTFSAVPLVSNWPRDSHEDGDLAKRGAAISRALAIVAELQQSLDIEAGGEIARNLRALYFFVTDRLLEANVTNRVEALDEAIGVLETLYEAWSEIAAKGLGRVAATG